ncbi:MAG: LOG family protein [Acidimicrobiia bacterium]|nr:LOG family protein [Acidimicrobiia bacterium]
MAYRLGQGELAAEIDALVAAASDNPNDDLIREMLVTVLKLHRDGADRADLLQVNTALKELRFTNLAFSPHRGQPKVTIFGSARTPPDAPEYEMAKVFAREMAALGWGVITGAGPGIMAAGNEGAGAESSYGIKIRLPFEAEANEWLGPNRVINYKYFFTRKLGLVKEAHGFAIFPGGFGTMDEAFEFLTLVQTGKSDMHPIVLLEPEGGDYWSSFLEFVTSQLGDRGLIRAEDLDLFTITHDVYEGIDEICGFYRNYQSQRYVDDLLVLRVVEAPDADALGRLSAEFADIVEAGAIERIAPTEVEIAEEDELGRERVAFRFDRRSFGRLRQLIDRLNDLIPPTHQVLPPHPFTEEQQDRPW